MEKPRNQYIRPLLTDMYQITMMYAYWKNKRHEDFAIFDAFFRKCPFKGEYCVFAGVSEIIEFLKNFRFNESEILYIQTLIPNVEEEFLDYLRKIDASCLKVSIVPDGTVVFPRINLIKVEGPLGIAQLCETTMLVLSNFSSLITTNAARFRKAAGDDKNLSEFGARRAQGPDGAMTASKYSYLGGFDSTSNLLAGMLYEIPTIGTHAHAYVTTYISSADLVSSTLDGRNLYELALKYKEENHFKTNEGELVSFVSYALAFPSKFLALVDTYDTLASGVPNFLSVALALNEIGYKAIGIRLDSGDLAYLSVEARKLFRIYAEKYGVPFENLIIVASNDINEPVLHALKNQGHEINTFGIGTNLVTCQAQPALGMVFKLVEVRDKPRMKISNDKEKITIPCSKNAYRLYGSDGIAICDVLTKSSEESPRTGEKILVRSPLDEKKRMFVTPSGVEPLQELYWDGKLIKDLPSLNVSRNRLKNQLQSIRSDITRSLNPTPYKVSVSSSLYDFMMHLWDSEVPIPEFK
jgi:nicotinate phosphoribosyltransferase